MGLWIRVTLKELAEPDSGERPGLVNLDRALWMEAYDESFPGTVVHFGSDEDVTIGESLDDIVEMLEQAQGAEEGEEEEDLIASEGESEE